MSLADISPDTVLTAIRAGHNTRGKLATHFEVLPGSKHLHEVLLEMWHRGLVKVHIEYGVHPDDYLITTTDTLI